MASALMRRVKELNTQREREDYEFDVLAAAADEQNTRVQQSLIKVELQIDERERGVEEIIERQNEQ